MNASPITLAAVSRRALLGVGIAASFYPAASWARTSPQNHLGLLLREDRLWGRTVAKRASGSLAMLFAKEIVMPSAGRLLWNASDAAESLQTSAVGAKGWEPFGGGISQCGEAGLTYGLVYATDTLGRSKLDKYLAYWVRSSAGWRIAAYKRAPLPEPQGNRPRLTRVRILPARTRAEYPADTASLMTAELEFSGEAARIGLGPAFASWGGRLSINLGSRHDIILGALNIGAAIGSTALGRLEWSSEATHVAAGGDFGLSWGWIRSVEDKEAQPIPFFTIWQRDEQGRWRYIAE